MEGPWGPSCAVLRAAWEQLAPDVVAVGTLPNPHEFLQPHTCSPAAMCHRLQATSPASCFQLGNDQLLPSSPSNGGQQWQSARGAKVPGGIAAELPRAPLQSHHSNQHHQPSVAYIDLSSLLTITACCFTGTKSCICRSIVI